MENKPYKTKGWHTYETAGTTAYRRALSFISAPGGPFRPGPDRRRLFGPLFGWQGVCALDAEICPHVHQLSKPKGPLPAAWRKIYLSPVSEPGRMGRLRPSFFCPLPAHKLRPCGKHYGQKELVCHGSFPGGISAVCEGKAEKIAPGEESSVRICHRRRYLRGGPVHP